MSAVTTMRYLQAVRSALHEEMVRDPDVFVMGEDVRVAINGATTGFVEEFGERRVVDTPISEAGFTGLAAGAAMAGLRPVLEYEINPLQYVAMDQLVNQLVRLRYMTGGQLRMPVTIRVAGAGMGAVAGVGGLAGQHSDSTWAMLMHVGMKVVVPTNPRDAKGLLKSAIRCDDPVIVYEPTVLYNNRGEVPDDEELIDLGVASVPREGGDVTVVATGHLVPEALRAAGELATEGIELEVIDPRTLYPLDVETILASVRKTHRLVVADDGYRFCGFASEVAAIVADRAFDDLRAPVKRVTRPMVPAPYAGVLLREVAVTGAQIVDAARSTMAGSLAAS